MSKLLIVDDDELALQLYEMLLEELPEVELIKASSGTGALQTLESNKQDWPDCILVDLHMPDMDGFELVSSLEQQYGAEGLPPIYILSSSVSPRHKKRATSFSAIKGFLSKPLRLDALRDHLNC